MKIISPSDHGRTHPRQFLHLDLVEGSKDHFSIWSWYNAEQIIHPYDHRKTQSKKCFHLVMIQHNQDIDHNIIVYVICKIVLHLIFPVLKHKSFFENIHCSIRNWLPESALPDNDNNNGHQSYIKNWMVNHKWTIQRNRNYSKTRKNTKKSQHRKLKRRATRILPNPDIYEGYLVLVYYMTLNELLVVKPGKNLIFGIWGGNNLRKRRKIHCQMNFRSDQSVHDEYYRMVFIRYALSDI